MKFSAHKGVNDTDLAAQIWNSPVNPHVSLPINERRALCLNSAEWYKLNGAEYRIEEQRARFLAESYLRRKSFLKKHNHSNQLQTEMHYQTLPQYDYIGCKFKYGHGNKHTYPHPTPGPSCSPVAHFAEKRNANSVYDHLNDRNYQLDGAIRELTEVALDHIKQDNAKMCSKNKLSTSQQEQIKPQQSISKVIDVNLSLPFQKTKSLPENIMKLVQSSRDLPQTRFRYQKASQPYPLVRSRPSGYQIAYHKAKEDFKVRHNLHDDNHHKKSRSKTLSSASSESSTSSVYGNFGSSSDYGRIKPKSGKHSKRNSNMGEGDGLPQIASCNKSKKGGKQVRAQWHQLYEQWSRTDNKMGKETSRPHTSSFPLLNDVNKYNFKN